MSKILITGYTGNVGSSVAKYLNQSNINYIAGVRSPDKFQTVPNNVELRKFDLEDSGTYKDALKGVKSIFLVRPPKITDVNGVFKPFIDYCKTENIEHIVFLSLLGVEKNPFPPHHKIEKLILESGIHYTFIRPSFFMQNLIDPHAEDIRDRNDIYIPSGNALISFIDTDDIGEIIKNVLTESGHHNRNYTITGSEAIDYNTVANVMSEILGRKITYSNPGLLRFRKELISRGTKKEFANVMTILYLTTKFGMAKQVTSTAEEILGRKPHTLHYFVKQHQDVWMNP